MPKDIPIEDALDVQLACERADSNASFGVLVNGVLFPVVRITLSDDKPQRVTAHLGEAFHVKTQRLFTIQGDHRYEQDEHGVTTLLLRDGAQLIEAE
jgi:hypothetical protein